VVTVPLDTWDQCYFLLLQNILCPTYNFLKFTQCQSFAGNGLTD
jgi:hypothetical protein